MNNKNLIWSLQFRWNLIFRIANCDSSCANHSPSTNWILILQMLLMIEFSLLHKNFKGWHLIFSKVHARHGHVLVYCLRKQRNIAISVVFHSFYKLSFLCWTISSIISKKFRYYLKNSLRSSTSILIWFDSLFAIFY